MYTFSDTTVAEFYGRNFYSIKNTDGKVVAYSEKVFEIPKEVRFLGTDKCLIFEKAVIRGGVIRGGEIRGGEIRGGVIWGGVIWGGEIWCGEIWCGSHEYGTIKASLLQIQGTRHFCYAYFLEDLTVGLGIGCERHTIQWWIENYESTGKSESYSADEITEYLEYIQLFAKRYAPELAGKSWGKV